MVTHNWSNLFLHTVAAVFADALKEEFYAGSINLTGFQCRRNIKKAMTVACKQFTPGAYVPWLNTCLTTLGC